MKKLYITFIIIFIAAIVLPSLWVFATPDKDFSDNENRMLQTRPELTAETILSGSFQDKLTKFISDQFPARDLWTESGTLIKKLIGFKDIGGAYLADDGYYFEKLPQEDFDTAKYKENLGHIESFAEKNSDRDCTVLMIPAASTVYPEKLPNNAKTYDYAAMFELAKSTLTSCDMPDIYGALSARKDEYIYYKTDHHWTTKGALCAYGLLTEGKGAYDGGLELFSDSFLGTTYSKTLDPRAECDSVYIAPVKGGIKVTADGKEMELYYTAAANEKDKYKVFFGGNHAQTLIEGGADNGKTLLVIKDSFANSLVPFLTADYETIIMIDLRYFNGSVQNIADEMDADEILFVYEASNIASENNIIKLTF